MSEASAPEGVDTTTLSVARMYDYYLGGTHNFPVDREAADAIIEVMPEIRDAAEANRGFLRRAARHMAGEGITQFIDIGCGLPTQNNTHEVVRQVNPDARVVYVDNDPMVRAHAVALLEREDAVRFVPGDLLDPDGILNHPDTRELIDFSRPVGLLIIALLNFVPDERDPWGLMARYTGVAATGSHLAISHLTDDGVPERSIGRLRDTYQRHGITFRTRDQVAAFFDGWHLLPPYEGAAPGLASIGDWGAHDPDLAAVEDERETGGGSAWAHCGVARLP